MKNTMDYLVGNTAIQIINTGKKIKIVNVEKEKRKRRILRSLFIAFFMAAVMVGSCFYVVSMQNTETMLDRQVYSLRGEIDELQKENSRLQKEYENKELDYEEIMEKAQELGMRFPTEAQVLTYHFRKSTAVRVH